MALYVQLFVLRTLPPFRPSSVSFQADLLTSNRIGLVGLQLCELYNEGVEIKQEENWQQRFVRSMKCCLTSIHVHFQAGQVVVRVQGNLRILPKSETKSQGPELAGYYYAILNHYSHTMIGEYTSHEPCPDSYNPKNSPKYAQDESTTRSAR